jgi:hypothetical protein
MLENEITLPNVSCSIEVAIHGKDHLSCPYLNFVRTQEETGSNRCDILLTVDIEKWSGKHWPFFDISHD